MKELTTVGRTQDSVSARILILLALILLVGCDPGMTVRQINSSVESESAAATTIPKISVDVKTTSQLIGQRLYDPHVVATNLSDAPVTITSIELIAGSRTLQNGTHAAKDYPVNLPAHSAVPLGVYLSLSDGVGKILRLGSLIGPMPQCNVADFMAENPCQLRFVVGSLDQTTVDVQKPTRECESINRLVVYGLELVRVLFSRCLVS